MKKKKCYDDDSKGDKDQNHHNNNDNDDVDDDETITTMITAKMPTKMPTKMTIMMTTKLSKSWWICLRMSINNLIVIQPRQCWYELPSEQRQISDDCSSFVLILIRMMTSTLKWAFIFPPPEGRWTITWIITTKTTTKMTMMLMMMTNKTKMMTEENPQVSVHLPSSWRHTACTSSISLASPHSSPRTTRPDVLLTPRYGESVDPDGAGDGDGGTWFCNGKLSWSKLLVLA